MITKKDILSVAANLMGPTADAENGNPEYERAIAEMVIDLIGGNPDDKDCMIALLHSIAE